MTIIFTLIAVIALSMSLHLLWAWYHIHASPHVEPVDIAVPNIAPYLSRMISDISGIAGIDPPSLYVCRAQLPNAFAVATIMRAEIFVTDELLEEANDRQDQFNYLMQVLCHEIAHIKNQDAIRLGLITYVYHLSQFLKLRVVETKCNQLIAKAEHRADLTADKLFEEVTLLLDENG